MDRAGLARHQWAARLKAGRWRGGRLGERTCGRKDTERQSNRESAQKLEGAWHGDSPRLF